MAIMSDEPLIDDSELDDFEWDDSFFEPEVLRAMGREQALHTIGYMMAMRLVNIEPAYADAYNNRPVADEDAPLPTITEEGEFLAVLIGMIDNMREPQE
jgi:hypothetical protein